MTRLHHSLIIPTLALAVACGPDIEDIDELYVSGASTKSVMEPDNSFAEVCVDHTHLVYAPEANNDVEWTLVEERFELEGEEPTGGMGIGDCKTYDGVTITQICATKSFGVLTYTLSTTVEHVDDGDVSLNSEVSGTVDLCGPFKPEE